MEPREHLSPRVIIAGTSSGVGKTTIATAIMASLAAKGLRVTPAKVGPDFIDPTYHELACGRRGTNLDTFLLGQHAVRDALLKASENSDISVIEGVMGLFDGSLMTRPDNTIGLDPRILPGSTAEVAALTETPVILVVDATSTSSSLAATVEGFRNYSSQVKVMGVIINNYRTASHLELIKGGFKHLDLEILGAIPKGAFTSWNSRHLGLVPAVEDPETIRRSINVLVTEIGDRLDSEKIIQIAHSATPLRGNLRAKVGLPPTRTVIAVAAGAAFSFVYPENVDALKQAGAEIRFFDPLNDQKLPGGTKGLYIGGGFPEIFAERLSKNSTLSVEVSSAVRAGLPTWAECGGLIWLADYVGQVPMTAALPLRIVMTSRLTLGYVSATSRVNNCIAETGERLYGHEFHYSESSPRGDAVTFTTRNGTKREGFASSSLFASYLHVHLGSQKHLAERFVSCCV